VVQGIVLLARGRKEGLARFGDTDQSFLASLAPLLALPLVSTGLLLIRGGGLGALTDLLAMLCALLAPPVLSHALARFWERETSWLRYATAFNWCQWVLPVVFLLIVVLVEGLLAAGVSNNAASKFAVAAITAYALWLHWFLARHGLDLSRLRAALLVVVVNAGSAALLLAPDLISLATERRT
jgi:hypothetical protein